MRRYTSAVITIVIIAGIYAGIFYLRRIRGYEFPIADGLAWSITDPPARLRRWIGVDLRWRKLVACSWETSNGGYVKVYRDGHAACSWETSNGGYVKVQRDGHAEFSLGSYHNEGTGFFTNEWPDDTNHNRLAHSLGFTMRFTQDGGHFWLELYPQKDKDGIMRGNGINARILRFDEAKRYGYEVYHARLKKAEQVMAHQPA